jgi:hypothetical protein
VSKSFRNNQSPDHNKPFHVCCDASNLQLGAVIMQDKAPVACCSRKLDSAQKNAQTWDAELQRLAPREPDEHVPQMLAPDAHTWCHIKELNAPWKMRSPNKLLESAARWRHFALGHIGSSCMGDTMQMHFCNRHLKNAVEDMAS